MVYVKNDGWTKASSLPKVFFATPCNDNWLSNR